MINMQLYCVWLTNYERQIIVLKNIKFIPIMVCHEIGGKFLFLVRDDFEKSSNLTEL